MKFFALEHSLKCIRLSIRLSVAKLTQKLELKTKQIVPCESTTEEVLFEWQHHRVSSKDSKVRTTH